MFETPMEQQGLNFSSPDGSDGTPKVLTAEELQYILHEHQKWLTLEGREGKRANFRNADLRGVDFGGMHLAEASFRGANVAGVNFSNADLRGADLAEADLQRANLRNAFLMGANFARANLRYADLQAADLGSANFGAAQMEGASLMNAKLHASNLREADLRGAVMRHAILTEANFRGANLREAILEDANLTQADCRDTNFENALFERTTIQDAIFRGANLTGVDMNKADFSTALDVSPEYHMQSYQNESRKLQEEQEKLKQMQEEFEKEQQRLNEYAAELERKAHELAVSREADFRRVDQMARVARSLGIYAIIWLVLVLIMLAITVVTAQSIPQENLHLVEIGVVFGVLGGILLLFGMTWYKARLGRKLLGGTVQHHVEEAAAHKLDRAAEAAHPQPFIDKSQLAPPATPKAFGLTRKSALGKKGSKPGMFGRKDRNSK